MTEKRSRSADVVAFAIVALALFSIYMQYENSRPTWVSLSPPELLTPTLPAREQAELKVQWHGYRQRAVADARWEYHLVEAASNDSVYKAEYSAHTHAKTEEEGPSVITRPLGRLEAGRYELVIRERTVLYAFWPVSSVHEQARFMIEVAEDGEQEP